MSSFSISITLNKLFLLNYITVYNIYLKRFLFLYHLNLVKMKFKIRPYHPSDLTSLYNICLLTSNSGKDGTKLFNDPDLVGHFYVAHSLGLLILILPK